MKETIRASGSRSADQAQEHDSLLSFYTTSAATVTSATTPITM